MIWNVWAASAFWAVVWVAVTQGLERAFALGVCLVTLGLAAWSLLPEPAEARR